MTIANMDPEHDDRCSGTRQRRREARRGLPRQRHQPAGVGRGEERPRVPPPARAAPAVDPAPCTVPYDRAALRVCIEATQNCAQACLECVDVCLADELAEELIDCIRTLSDTAGVCEVNSRVLLRRTGPDDSAARDLLATCRSACRSARERCEELLILDHCRVCARVCRSAERRCRALLASAQTEQPAAGNRTTGIVTAGPRRWWG